MKGRYLTGLFVIFSLLMQEKIIAQPFTLDERIQPRQLELVNYRKDDPKRKGRINVTEVTQEKDTLYYFVKDISIYSPVYFSITTENTAVPVKLSLNKENWIQAHRKGETDDKGRWETKFKTEGDFGIMVVPGEKPAKYTLVTWVGDEAKDIGMGSPFKGGGSGTKSSGGGNKLPWIIAGAAVLLVVVILFIKRKKN